MDDLIVLIISIVFVAVVVGLFRVFARFVFQVQESKKCR